MAETTALALIIMETMPEMPLVNAVRIAARLIAAGYGKAPF